MKIEKGVMVVKDGKGWGVAYYDGQAREDGWVDLEVATISSPRFCTKTTDLTYRGSHYVDELKKGKLVHVEKTITIKILDEDS